MLRKVLVLAIVVLICSCNISIAATNKEKQTEERKETAAEMYISATEKLVVDVTLGEGTTKMIYSKVKICGIDKDGIYFIDSDGKHRYYRGNFHLEGRAPDPNGIDQSF